MNLLSSETAEMVPDEFLSWLMSDLDGKDVSSLCPTPNKIPMTVKSDLPEQPAVSGQFQAYEVASTSSSSSSYVGDAMMNPIQSIPLNPPYINENVPGQGTYPLPESYPPQAPLPPPEFSVGSSDSPRGRQQGEEGEDQVGDSTDQDQESNNKVGGKRKVPRSSEIAKECRRRQKEKKDELENRVAALKKENQELREHFQNVSQRTTDIQRQRASMESLMHKRLKEIEKLPEDSEERKNLVSLVMKFTDLYADYGSCRQKEIAFHLAQLEKLILPTRVTKMILWTLQQDYKFFEEKNSPIWGILVKELDMTPDQISFLTKQRSEVLNLLLHLKESLNLINELKVSIKDKHETFDRECGKITTEASANQTVRFILWITNNADKLAKVIPDFERIVPHVSHAPNVSMP